MTTGNSESQDTELSIILLSFNTAQITEDCIHSIYKSFKDSSVLFEVIVLDNLSTDNSVEVLKKLAKEYPSLQLIESKENTGFAKGNNIASIQAKGKYIMFLNSDTVVLENAIEKLLNFYKENSSKVQFVGAKLLNSDKTDQPSCGPFYSLPVVFGALFLRGDYWGLTRSSPNVTKQVDWVSGACILTTKELFEKVGKFDENIFMYMEEIDLLYRAKKQGFATYFYPDAQFIHLGSASSGERTYPILQVYNGFLFFYNKHHSRFAVAILRVMLQLKAVFAVMLGKITGRQYLIQTYEKAYKLATMA